MDISVVIVSYNVSSFLDQALTTVKDAAKGLEYEIFVVDNASSDDSVEMVRSKHPKVKLIANKENVGFGSANNQALELAAGKYILILNPDTVLRHDTLRIMIDFLDNHPKAGAAGCKVINPDGSLQLACRRGFPTPGGAFFKMVGLSNLFPKSKTFGAYNLTYLDPESLTEVDAISGSFMMLRKQALSEVGFFDEDFFMYGEDLDLCYRIKHAGWKIFYVPTTEIIHFKGESTKTVPTMQSVWTFYDAMQIFVDKHHGKESRLQFPRWLLIAGIYAGMGWVYGLNVLKNIRQPVRDLILLNISLVLGIFMRFNISLENAPEYTKLQWISIFLVYSLLYMTTFYFLGMYHRYRNSSERALLSVFIGFLFNIFIVNFIKEYNFSRLASFYSWGFNSIFISGWRFLIEELYSGKTGLIIKRAIIVGSLSDAVTLRNILEKSEHTSYDFVGCVETTPDAIRGREVDGLHILGLVDELSAIMHEYSIDVAIMAGSSLPYSKILSIGSKIGSLKRPEFKFVPEIPEQEMPGQITLLDILPGKVI